MSERKIWLEASKMGNIKLIKELINKNETNINWIDDSNYNTALIYASNNGYEDIVKVLLKQRNIAVNIINSDYDSALKCAVWNNHFNIVKILCENKDININWSNVYFGTHTALISACYLNYYNIAEYLYFFVKSIKVVILPNA